MGDPENEIVISGIGGKFPESNNVLELQEKLFAKIDVVTNEMRWTPDTVGVGKMQHIDTFDSSPFKMHSKLVRSCDPTTTQTLERAFESIIDAGMNPFAMSGRNIAVISASMISDSENSRAGTSYETSGFSIMGHNRSMVANRVSYTFNFTGPSYSIHTSWAGGVTAIEQGADLITKGFCEAAVVTTASLIFSRAASTEYSEMNLLKPGSRCRSFDANANGTCRSEGVVAFFLQKASDAKRNYATLISARSLCLGLRSSSLIRFDSFMRESLHDFYKRFNINPEEISYLEADGSGVKFFDTIELNALASVFFEKRKEPLAIGSVKSNVGNTDASSAFLGITKSIIAMETGMIPPNIHYSNPNPEVPALVNGQFQPVIEATELKGDLISVNTLSLGGSLGHVVLRRNPKEKKKLNAETVPDKMPRLIMFSARNENGAKLNSEKLQSMPVDVEYAALVNDVFNSYIPGYLWKSFVIVPTTEVTYNMKNADAVKQPLWFVFSGMGSQWPMMGRDLMHIPIFSSAVDKCDSVLRPLGVDIRHILTSDDPSLFDNILNCFVGIAAIQIGLVDILRTIGLEPDGMVGHSVGELGCAYADGCFTAEEMVLAAYARGKASLESEVIPGMMAAVGLGYKDIKEDLPASIDVACHNSSDSCTLSGPTDDVIDYVKRLKDEKVFAKAVSAGNIAYHSRYIQSVGPKLLEYLTQFVKDPKPRSSKWISSSIPEENWSSPLAQLSSAEYHTNNLLSPVLFEEASRHIPDNAIVVEIAPHGLLQAILRRSLNKACINIPLTSRQSPDQVTHVLKALGTLYLNNINFNINALYPEVEYPVSRGTPYLAPLVTWDHHENWFGEFESILQLMTQHSNEREKGLNEKEEDYVQLMSHRIEDRAILPLSQILAYVWKVYLESCGLEFEKESVIFEDVIMSKQVAIQPFSQQLLISLRKGTSNFGVLLKEKYVFGETFVTGKIKRLTNQPMLDYAPNEEHEESQDEVKVTKEEILKVLMQFGYQLGTEFQTFKEMSLNNGGFTAKVEWTGNIVTFLDGVMKLLVFQRMVSEQKFLYPSSIRSLHVDSKAFHSFEAGTEVEIHYDSKCNIMRCQGLELVGLTLSPDLSIHRADPPLLWREKLFVPFNGNDLKLDQFLSVSMQLVADQGLNSWRSKAAQISVNEISGSNGTLAPSKLCRSLKAVVSNLPHISVKVQEMDFNQAKEKLMFNKPGSRETYLLTGDFDSLRQLVTPSTPPEGCNVFLLAHINSLQSLSNGSAFLAPIFSLTLKEGGYLVLMKKKTQVKHTRVLELENEQWFSELAKLFNGKDDGHPVVLVSRKWKPEEILPSLAKQKYAHRFRCIFLDKISPKFSINSPLFYKQLSLGLSISHLNQGVWGSNFTLNVDFNSLRDVGNFKPLITSSDSSLEVNTVALNTTHVFYQPHELDQVQLQYLDYCGTKDRHKRVMGVAQFNPLTNCLTPDSLLQWQVPPQWSMEDAVTIPNAYALAYYCVLFKAKAAGRSVLVHIGSSPTSQAFLAVCFQAECDVFVTVEDEKQIPSLLKAFPQMKSKQVLPLNQFVMTLKLKTKGKGVDVVINCLSDSQATESIKCVGYDATFIQLNSVEQRRRETFGMELFLRNNRIYGCSLANISNEDDEMKKLLQNCVECGIKKNVVKPLQKKLFSLQNFTEAVDNVKVNSCKEKTVVVNKAQQLEGLSRRSGLGFQCEPDKCYVIAGSGEGLWLDLAEWLIQRGARKLLVTPDKDTLDISFCQRYDRLVSLCYVRVMMTSSNRLDSQSGATDLLRAAASFGPVAAVFCLALEENSPKVMQLHLASQQVAPQLKHFVCLLGGSSSVCQTRANLGLPASLIQKESVQLRPQAIFPYLSSVLADSSTNYHWYLVSQQVSTAEQVDEKLVDQDPTTFLPLVVEDLLELADEVSSQPSFREVVTRSPGHREVQYNLLPVFILTGSLTAHIQPFIRQLMHPAYCTSLPENIQSIEETAKVLLQEVMRVQPEGPCNLVGESWSGSLALELAMLLESRGRQVTLFLLNGTPQTAQQYAKLLCDKNQSSLAVSLLATLFDLETEIVKDLSELNSWEEQLQRALQEVHPKCGAKDKGTSKQSNCEKLKLSKALTALENHLSAILRYKPEKNVFKGDVHLIRPRPASDVDFCGLQLHCQQRPTVCITEDKSHKEMISNRNCATIINDNTAYSWEL